MDARETQKLLIKPAIPHLAGDFRIVKGNFLIKYPISDIVRDFVSEDLPIKMIFTYIHFLNHYIYYLTTFIYHLVTG